MSTMINVAVGKSTNIIPAALATVFMLAKYRRKQDITHRMFSCCGSTRSSKILPTISGNFQSPVDILRSATVKDNLLSEKPLQLTTDTSIFTLKNVGHSLDAQPVSGKSFELSGGPLANPYTLVGFHFHWVREHEPWSEHTVDSKPSAGELHLVHLNKAKYKSVKDALSYKDGLCVLGVLLEIDDAKHEEIGKIVKYCGDVEFKDASVTMNEPFCPYSLLPSDINSYWTYPGSLTTPPYSECVTWVVFKDPLRLSKNQWKQFTILKPITAREAKKQQTNQSPLPEVKNNVREIQPIKDRIVKATFEN